MSTDPSHSQTGTGAPEVTAPIPVRAARGTRRQSHAAGNARKSHTSGHRRPDRPHDAGKSGRRPRRRRAGLIALGALAGCAAAVYVAGVVAFSNICYPNTHAAGTDLSLMDRSSAAGRIEAAAKGYRLTVEGAGFSWDYKPDEPLDIVDGAALADAIIETNEPFAWPVHLVEALMGKTDTARAKRAAQAGAGDEDASAAVDELPDSFDRAGFEGSLSASIEEYNAGRSGSFDAVGAYDPEAGAFTVEHALSQRTLDADAVLTQALEAVATLSPNVELDEHDFAPLAGDADEKDLERACKAANELIGTNVTLKMGGTEVAALDGAQLAQWITFDEALVPSLDTGMLTSWVRELAETKLDTVGSERTYTRPDGKQVRVAGGSYGWMSDEAKLVQLLQDAVANKQQGDIEVPTIAQGARYADMGQPDWGAYVDIDLTEQHARYYDASGALLWESGIITGNPNEGDATPTGVYSLNSNDGASVLKGEIDPETKKPEYESPVSYWMPFIGNLIGLHDATWQADSSFSNPNAYLSVGSHGCVNLPLQKAKELSGIIHVGDCVVVHS